MHQGLPSGDKQALQHDAPVRLVQKHAGCGSRSGQGCKRQRNVDGAVQKQSKQPTNKRKTGMKQAFKEANKEDRVRDSARGRRTGTIKLSETD